MKKIYYNGDILTMENSDYEAIYVEDGVIKKCGNYSDVNSKIKITKKVGIIITSFGNEKLS